MKFYVQVVMTLFCIVSFPVIALCEASNTLVCNANYQPNGPGTDPVSKKLEIVEQLEAKTVFKTTLEGFEFSVMRHRPFTTLYMTIREGQHQLVTSTSRVPTSDHNDSLVDIRIRDKLRLYLTCDFIEFRP